MIEVSININREEEIYSVQAVRVYPTRRQPNIGELCTYVVYNRPDEIEPIATIKFPYGNAMTLSIELLKTLEEHFVREEANSS